MAMDAALSTRPASSLVAGAFPPATVPNPRELHLLKSYPTPSTHLFPLLLSTTEPHLLSSSPLSSLAPKPRLPLNPPPPIRPTSRAHRRAATGYAAALIDAASCAGALAAVARDVRRLARAVGPVLDDVERRGEAVLAAVEGGGFDPRVAALVRMLVGKGRVGLVGAVLGEFWRIWEVMSGTQRVVVVVMGAVEVKE